MEKIKFTGYELINPIKKLKDKKDTKDSCISAYNSSILL